MTKDCMKYTKPALSFVEQAQRLLDHGRLMRETENAVERSNEKFVQRFFNKYTSEPRLPL